MTLPILPENICIVTIDLGVTTGMYHNCEDKFFTVVDSANVISTLDRIDPEIIVLEQMPMFISSYETYALVYARLRSRADIITYQPSEWKPMAKARKWTHEKAVNQHEKDAYGLYRYHVLLNNLFQKGEK